MKKFLTVTLLACSVAACNSGSDDSHSTSGSDAGNQATETAKPAAKGVGDIVNSAMEKATDPNVQGCLSNVKAKEFKAALPLCLKAAHIEPKNTEVQAALNSAKANAGVDTAAADDAKAKLDGAKNQLDGMKDMGKGMGLP